MNYQMEIMDGKVLDEDIEFLSSLHDLLFHFPKIDVWWGPHKEYMRVLPSWLVQHFCMYFDSNYAEEVMVGLDSLGCEFCQISYLRFKAISIMGWDEVLDPCFDILEEWIATGQFARNDIKKDRALRMRGDLLKSIRVKKDSLIVIQDKLLDLEHDMRKKGWL